MLVTQACFHFANSSTLSLTGCKHPHLLPLPPPPPPQKKMKTGLGRGIENGHACPERLQEPTFACALTVRTPQRVPDGRGLRKSQASHILAAPASHSLWELEAPGASPSLRGRVSAVHRGAPVCLLRPERACFPALALRPPSPHQGRKRATTATGHRRPGLLRPFDAFQANSPAPGTPSTAPRGVASRPWILEGSFTSKGGFSRRKKPRFSGSDLVF